MRKKRAQSSFELTTLIVIILAALLTMQVYIKRGMQGRWRAATDEFGEQYDPYAMCGTITHHMSGTSITKVITIPDGPKAMHSLRYDQANTVETKTGAMVVGTVP